MIFFVLRASLMGWNSSLPEAHCASTSGRLRLPPFVLDFLRRKAFVNSFGPSYMKLFAVIVLVVSPSYLSYPWYQNLRTPISNAGLVVGEQAILRTSDRSFFLSPYMRGPLLSFWFVLPTLSLNPDWNARQACKHWEDALPIAANTCQSPWCSKFLIVCL